MPILNKLEKRVCGALIDLKIAKLVSDKKKYYSIDLGWLWKNMSDLQSFYPASSRVEQKIGV